MVVDEDFWLSVKTHLKRFNKKNLCSFLCAFGCHYAVQETMKCSAVGLPSSLRARNR